MTTLRAQTRSNTELSPDEFVRQLALDDPSARGQAADALAVMRDVAVPSLVDAVRRGAGRQALLSLHTLVRIGGDAAKRTVLEVLAECRDTNLLHAAIDGSVLLGLREAVPELQKHAVSQDPWLRLAAVQALCFIIGPNVAELIDVDTCDQLVLDCILDAARTASDHSWVLPLLEILSGNRLASSGVARREVAAIIVSILETGGDEQALESARRLLRHLSTESVTGFRET